MPVTLKLQDSQDQKKSTSNPDRLSNTHTGEDSIKTVQSEAFTNKRIYIEKYTAKMMDPKNNKNGVGYVKPGFESVRDLFYAGFRDGSRLHCAQVLLTLNQAIIFLFIFIDSKK